MGSVGDCYDNALCEESAKLCGATWDADLSAMTAVG